MSDSWIPLWSSIVESSLWEEPDVVVKVFLTMMAKKDSDHVVRADPYRIAKWANKTEAEVISALKVLEAPDRRKISRQKDEGRRIRPVEGGWLIINGEKYREEIQKLFYRARRAELQRDYRKRQKQKPGGGPQATEREQERAFENGEVDADGVSVRASSEDELARQRREGQ
jgi:hypothetical protein